MEVTYDPRVNVAYIRLRERALGVETLHVSDELNIDIAPDGSVYGIELLNANEQLAGVGGARFALTNPMSGKRIEVRFPGDAA